MERLSGWLTAGAFAALCGTTKETLRHYRDLGLLVPVRRGENGYGYYDAEQFYDFYAIAIFRQTGTPLTEIRRCLQDQSAGGTLALLREQRERLGEERRRMGELCLMGLPMGLQYSITAIGSVMIQSAVNSLGTAYVGAVTAAGRVTGVLACPFDAMGCTMATYGGQNVGARKWDRLHEGLRACVLLGAGYAALSFGAVLLFSGPMNMLFLSADSAGELLPLAKEYLTINAAFYFLLSLVNIFRFLIQGMGFSPLAVLAGVLEMVGRWAVALLVPSFGFTAAAFASPAAWVLADLFLVPAYFWCHRRLTRPRPQRRRAAAVKLG